MGTELPFQMIHRTSSTSDSTLKRLSLGFNGLVSDWYWMRALQYVGQRIINHQGNQQLDNLGGVGPEVTCTAPGSLHNTRSAIHAALLSTLQSYYRTLKEAIRLTQRKGIAANPTDWQLPQYLA